MSKRDYYEVLGVGRDASQKDVADAYRKLALKHHPDRNPGDDEAVVRFKEAAEAFEILHDPNKRERYDRYGHAGVDGSGPQFADINDIFSAFGDMFSEGPFADLFGGRRRGGRRVHRGDDIECELTIDLHDAARGVSRDIKFKRHQKCEECNGTGGKDGSQPDPCEYCGGHGQVVRASGFFRVQTTCPACHGQGTVVKNPCAKCRGSAFVLREVVNPVAVPAGIDHGNRLRVQGEGDPSPDGGPPGDCYVRINVKPHPLFQRDGLHLVCQVPIGYSQAALGATIEVPTLDGREELKIPAGTQPGEQFRLKQKGMPNLRGRQRGDLIVLVQIEVPKKLTERQEELLRELAQEEDENVSPRQKSFFEKLKDYFVPDEDEARTED